MSQLDPNFEIAVVGASCILPGANNPQEFWEGLERGQSQIQPISKSRWERDFHLSPYREEYDKTYSDYCAEISKQTYENFKQQYSLEDGLSNRLEVLLTAGFDQLRRQFAWEKYRDNLGLYLGLMNPDESLYAAIFERKSTAFRSRVLEKLEELERAEANKLFDQYQAKALENFRIHEAHILATARLAGLQERFDFRGPSLLLDAACASSLASFDVCIRKLRQNEISLAVGGGVESNLGPGTFVLFSKVGALAQKHCKPFDKSSDGINQGEGIVLFALKRLATALADGDPILGLLRNVGGSSDGRVTSLFQPSMHGQILAYNRALQGLESRRLDFIEAHGTGTQIGDRTEALSIETFFRGFKVPVGSVKYLLGHTKATAGAAGALKCLLMMKNQKIPKSGYLENSVFRKESAPFVNTTDVPLDPSQEFYRMGVSSFGFGGCNFHLLLESFQPKNLAQVKVSAPKPDAMAILADVQLNAKDFTPEWFTGKNVEYRLPPKSLNNIDQMQLFAVRATQLAFEQAQLSLDMVDRERVSVISASTIGLDILEPMSLRLSIDWLMELLKREKTERPELTSLIDKLIEASHQIKNRYEPVSEDSGPGILNNVVAGRVTNAFNFKGPNFNVDCDLASPAAALDLARSVLVESPEQLIVVVGVEETLDEDKLKIQRLGVTCRLVTSPSYCRKLLAHPKYVLQVERQV